MVDDQTSLYRYFDREGALIYVGVTSRGATRNVEHNTTKGWWQYVAHQQVEHFSTRAAALAAEKRAILAFRPHLDGKYLPDEVTHARARIRWNGNAKPPTFSVVKVLLNEALTHDLLDGGRGNE